MAFSTTPPDASQPLRGIRVVEMGLFHAGPTATGMLASLGAEVIKVEDPKSADPGRAVTRIYGQDCTLPGGRNVPFETYNANKKGVTLSLKHPEGLRLFYELIDTCDVFLHNMRAETAVKLKIDYDSLIGRNPKLVYAAISGFGPVGEDASRPGLDPVGLARSGVMAGLSGGSQRPPLLPAMSIADRVSGMVMGYGILAALLARDRTGLPQRVDTSLLGGAMWLGQLNLQYALFTGKELLPTDHSSDALLNSYQCADDSWIFIAALTPKGWLALCAGLELPDLACDARLDTPEGRWTHRAELVSILVARFVSRPSSYWMQSFSRQPDLIFELVKRPQDIADDAQMLANGYLVELEDAGGTSKRVAFPLHVNGAPAGRAGPAPGHGEHNAEVLGLSAEELAELRAQGAV